MWRRQSRPQRKRSTAGSSKPRSRRRWIARSGSSRNPPPLVKFVNFTPTEAEVKQILKADVAPCVIKHDPGPYANHLGRYLTAGECLRLQGFNPSKVRRPQVTPLQMRQLCGNAMHCGLLAEVLALLIDKTE